MGTIDGTDIKYNADLTYIFDGLCKTEDDQTACKFKPFIIHSSFFQAAKDLTLYIPIDIVDQLPADTFEGPILTLSELTAQ